MSANEQGPVINQLHAKSLSQPNPSMKILRNKVGDKVWLVTDLATGKDWNLHFKDFNERDRLWLQAIILYKFPYSDAKNHLNYASATVARLFHSCKRLINYLAKLPSEKQILQNWLMPDVVQFIQTISRYDDGSLKSNSYTFSVYNALELTYHLHREQDGLPFKLTKGLFREAMAPILKALDKSYTEWENGSSRQMLPMSVGTLLLADAINCIRSTQCKLLQCFFQAHRDGLVSYNVFANPNRRGAFNSNIPEFLSINSSSRKSSSGRRHYENRVEFVNRLHEIDPDLTDFPFKCGDTINNYCAEIEGACAIILLAVTGMRGIEMHSIKANWIESIDYLDVSGEWTVDAIFKSKINKTSGGIIAKKGLSPLGVEVFELLNKLSWVDKEFHGLDLFSPTYKSKFGKTKKPKDTRSSYNKNTLSRRIIDYYDGFVARSHTSVKESYPNITPHALRHYKMAFGLRKFDGNVEEMISQEFRHHKRLHTPVYAKNKLNEEEEAYTKREYVQEIVKRILINEPNDRWVGSSATKVRKAAQNLLSGQDIELLSLQELALFHEEMQESIDTMKFHSYGLCFVMKDSKRQAKCGIQDNIVKTGDANSKTCYQCVNFCVNNKSHYAELDMNRRRWQATANDPLLSKFPLANVAKLIVKKIESLQTKLEVSDG